MTTTDQQLNLTVTRTPIARYSFAGLVFNEDSTREITEISDTAALAAAPAGCFGWELGERVTVDVAEMLPRGLPDDFPTVLRHATYRPGMTYRAGTVMNASDVVAWGHEHGEKVDVLLSNMRSNRWHHVILTHIGIWQPFKDDDRVLHTGAE